MPFQSKRGDARDVSPAPAGDGPGVAIAPLDSETVISGAVIGAAAGLREAPPPDDAGGARINAGFEIGALLAGFTPVQINHANDALARFIDQAVAAAKGGADGAVTLRFEAGRDGSRRVRIGVTVGGRLAAEPAVFEAAKAEG